MKFMTSKPRHINEINTALGPLRMRAWPLSRAGVPAERGDSCNREPFGS